MADTLEDEPHTGLEKVIWWTEYVIRHKGAPYFKSPALDMPWYQYYLIDVLGFFFAILATVFYTFYRLLRMMITCSKTSPEPLKYKKKTS